MSILLPLLRLQKCIYTVKSIYEQVARDLKKVLFQKGTQASHIHLKVDKGTLHIVCIYYNKYFCSRQNVDYNV